jgi:hypothetical protein
MSKIVFLTEKQLEQLKWDKISARYEKKGNDQVKEYLKTINTNVARRTKETGEFGSSSKFGKESSSPQKGSTTNGSMPSNAGVGEKRVRDQDDDKDNRPMKKSSDGPTQASPGTGDKRQRDETDDKDNRPTKKMVSNSSANVGTVKNTVLPGKKPVDAKPLPANAPAGTTKPKSTTVTPKPSSSSFFSSLKASKTTTPVTVAKPGQPSGQSRLVSCLHS